MTFDFADVLKLVLWVFFGALTLALFMAIGLGKSAKARLGGALMVLAFFGAITALAYYKLIADDTLIGGQGADMLVGGAGNDTYRYRSGDGNDTVSEAGGDDTVELLDLNPGDVRIVQGLNGAPDLIVDALTGQTITLDLNLVSPGWSADGSQVEHLRFADGTVWNSEQMRAAAELERSVSLMVQAMATFSVPAPGLVTSTSLDDQARLAPTLAASWG